MGSVVAGAWFVGTSTLFDGAVGQAASVLGAIGLAGLVPHFLLNAKLRRDVLIANLSYAQRLNVLDQHVIVNVVDNNDRLAEVNDKLLEVTGYTREELIGQPVKMLYQVGVGRQVAQEIRSFLVNGKTWQGETPLRRADGSVIFTKTTIIPLFDADGEWLGSIAARTDVTHLNKLMAEHETVETLDELRDDVWIIDAETEQFTYMNKAATDRLNWQGCDYQERRLSDIADCAGVDSILSACQSVKDSRDFTSHFETRFMDTPFNVSVKFLRVGTQADRFLIMLNDITDRIEEEQAKSDFISTVSHELRSPLTSIKGSMGLLLSKAAGDLPDKAVSLLEIAHRNADRLVLIINDILDLEKISAGHMEFDKASVDLSALIKETNEANSTLRQRFALDVQSVGTDQSLWLETDANRLIQVLNNFISNAFKFSPAGGKVILCAEDLGDCVRVSVTDEGPGIPTSEHDKIFERFADLNNSDRASKGGTGLGLSICKAIIEGLGGTIGFDTKIGIGTTFYFVLPKTEGLRQSIEDGKIMSEAS